VVHLVARPANARTNFSIIIVIFRYFGAYVVHAAWQQRSMQQQ
jgi:hypothetical protein